MPYRVFDHLEIRCPQLGGEVTFGYCRAMADGLPCAKALDCYHLKFPVREYFHRVLTPEAFARIFESEQTGRYQKFLKTVAQAQKQKSS